MSWVFEFSDSEVASVRADADTLVVRFSAAAVVKADSREVGFLQSVELDLRQASWRGETGLCFGRLSSGQLTVGSAVVAPVSIPYELNETVVLELAFRNGEVLSVQAAGAALRLRGPLSVGESYAC